MECRTIDRELLEEYEQGREQGKEAEDPIAALLEKFASVFEWPTTLPLQRNIDHHIYLKSGADPVECQALPVCTPPEGRNGEAGG